MTRCAQIAPPEGPTSAQRAASGGDSWLGLTEIEATERARAAAEHRDRPALAGLLLAHLRLRGRSGGLASRHTATAYLRGLELLLCHANGEPLTVRTRARDTAEALPAPDPVQVDPIDLLVPPRDWGFGFARALEAAGLAPSTVRARLAAARAVFAALRWAGATRLDPFCDVRAATDHTPAWEQRPAYSPREVDALLGTARDAREKVAVLLLAHGGLRAAEAADLRWADLDLPAATASVLGKGRRRRTVCLSRSLQSAIEDLDRDRAGNAAHSRVLGLRRSGLASLLAALAARARVRWRGAHALRHHAGTRLYAETRDLGFVAAHLGHTRPETAQRYAGRPAGLGEVIARW